MTGIVLCDDLIFFSRISEAARAAGLKVVQARTPTEASSLAAKNAAAAIILDLQIPVLDLPALLAEVRPAGSKSPTVVAYGSHVEAETLRAARRAGCDRVMPRSQFVEVLDGEIAGWFAPGS